MRGFITRRFSMTQANIGYYDMEKNEMVLLCTISGQWKNTEQILRHCKKHRKDLDIPEGKQITVLSVHTETELRKMTYETFYKNSVPVEEKKPEAAKTNKRKG